MTGRPLVQTCSGYHRRRAGRGKPARKERSGQLVGPSTRTQVEKRARDHRSRVFVVTEVLCTQGDEQVGRTRAEVDKSSDVSAGTSSSLHHRVVQTLDSLSRLPKFNNGRGEKGLQATDYDEWNQKLISLRCEIKDQIIELEGSEDRLNALQRTKMRRLRSDLDRLTYEILDFNEGFLVYYVRKFTSRSSNNDEADIRSSARLGLLSALERYDPTRIKAERASFARWAMQYIKREVFKAVRDIDHPNLTLGAFEARDKVLKAQKRLVGTEDDKPVSIEEIASEAGISVSQTRFILEAPHMVSLSAPVLSGEGDSTIGDLIEDDRRALEDQVIFNEEVDNLERYGLTKLTAREHMVLSFRNGLAGEPELTLEELAPVLQLSREAVRNIESKALAKLVHPVTLRRILRAGRS